MLGWIADSNQQMEAQPELEEPAVKGGHDAQK